MNKTARRILIAVVLFILVAFGLFAGFGMYEGYRIQQKQLWLLHDRENSFRANPTLHNSLVLMDEYYWLLKDYDKANYYADYCFKLGVETTRRAWYVHMVKADLEAKNHNFEQACNNLNLGLQLAKDYKITEVQINWFKYQDLLKTCKAREKK